MASTLLGIFDDPTAARDAMDELQASGLVLEDVSIISRSTETAGVADHDHLNAGEGAAVGAVWGGLVGLAALLIPGIGPFIAGGAVVAALTGAAAGAVVGGVAGALMNHAGISEEQAHDYAAMVQGGKTLLIVKMREADAEAVRRIMAGAGANSIRDNQTDVAGAGGPVRVAGVESGSWDAEPDLAPGGATVHGASGMPATAAPAASGQGLAGLPGINTIPAAVGVVGTRGIYETPTQSGAADLVGARREIDNMAAGTEDAYGTPQTDKQGRAILTEGWDRIGHVGDRQGEKLDDEASLDVDKRG